MSFSSVLRKRTREETTDESQSHAMYVKCVEAASKRGCSSSSLSHGRTFVRFDLSQQADGESATSTVDRDLAIDLSTLKMLLNSCLVAGATDVCVGEVAHRACFVVYHSGTADESARKVARKGHEGVANQSASTAEPGMWHRIVRKWEELLARTNGGRSIASQNEAAVDTPGLNDVRASAPSPTPTVGYCEASDTLVAVARLLSRTGDEGSLEDADSKPRVFGKIVINKVSRKNTALAEPPDSLCAPLLPGSALSLHKLFQNLDRHHVTDGMLTTSLKRLPHKNEPDHGSNTEEEGGHPGSKQFTPLQRMHLMLSFS